MADGIKTALAIADDLFRGVGDAAAPAAVERSGPQGGRPRGARNRSTEQWRRYLIGRHGSPLERLLELAMGDTQAFAREHALPLPEAIKVQISALTAALPYLHQRQPLAIESVGQQRGLLVIGDLGSVAAASYGLALPLADNEQNQRVIDGTAEQSDYVQSDDEANTMQSQDNPDAAD